MNPTYFGYSNARPTNVQISLYIVHDVINKHPRTIEGFHNAASDIVQRTGAPIHQAYGELRKYWY